MMKLTSLILLASIALSSTVHGETTLIKNVQGYTIENNTLKEFSAMLFTDDKIDKLFESSQKLPESPSIKVINGNGKTLLPGLIDAHGHVLSYGMSLLTADLVNSQSEQEAVLRAVKYAKENTASLWIQGRGWNQVQWSSNQYPKAKSLDKYFPDTPVWLRRVDGHAGWANSKAMQLASITKDTLTPSGGDIIRDKDGQPTGVFIDNAMDLITKSIAPATKAENKAALVKAMKSLASMGLTSVHDAGIGVAGTGKTYLAVACAVEALERQEVRRILLTRPAVEAGEKLGFLPGDLSQKVDPYLRPLYDALFEMLGFEKVEKLIERNVIEIAPLAYMRGRTLNDAFIILDESQNTTVEQMKMFLTRIGFNARAVITGDITQVDLPRGQTSGLRHAMDVLVDTDGISFDFFQSKDVVRHPVVARIIDAYDSYEKKQTRIANQRKEQATKKTN